MRKETLKQSDLAKMAAIANAQRVEIELILGDRTIRVRPERTLDEREPVDDVERAIAAFEAKHGRD